tara:strand:+ start:296 stop:5149 length:4854 start_codon:yes stop_codon:yes gene_type:complete
MSKNILSDNILDYGKEDVLKFIQTTIRQQNNVKEDILDEIKYITGKVKEDEKVEDPVLGTVTVLDNTIIEDRSTQGFYYERLWDLCIKFGVTDLTLPAIKGKLQTTHIIDGNTNSLDIEFKSNCWDGKELNKYLHQKVRSGNSGGYSDITFLNKVIDDEGKEIGEELILISVKYFKNEKGIDKYDIDKLCALIKAHEKKERTVKIYIFVKNKDNAIKKFKSQNTSSNILIKYINPGGNYENIYDINDLQDSFFKLKKLLALYNYLDGDDNITKFQKNYLNVLKSVYIPRFHQKLFTLKINKLIQERNEKNILVGAIPRSGKSYIMAGTILEYIKQHELSNSSKKLKFLIMTPAPNETIPEYESIFNNYIEFEGIEVITSTQEHIINSNKICSNNNKHCVILISKQKLGWNDGSKEDKLTDDNEIQNIKKNVKKLFGTKPDINIMFLDEAHFGMSTKKAKNIVDFFNSTIENTIKIYVTATYNKPIETYGISSNSTLTWDLNDIKIMQNLNEETITNNSIQDRFNKSIYTDALKYFGDNTGISLIDNLKKEYNVYPKPHLITTVWDNKRLDIERQKVGNTEFGWDMNKLFSTEKDSFKNEEQIRVMMRYYFGYPVKGDNYADQSFFRKDGILPRIQDICLEKSCRTLQPQHKTTQLWFLPVGSGIIENKINALIILFKSSEFKEIKQKYHFFVAVMVNDENQITDNGVTYLKKARDIKREIEAVEKKMKQESLSDNLIILAGSRLQLGISLRNVDIVTLWNSSSSEDAMYQMMFRSMTEVNVPPCKPKAYCNEKKYGFMVDMNPQRALSTTLLFGTNLSKAGGNTQQYRQITDLISIDEDIMKARYGDDAKGKDKFTKELMNQLLESWNVNTGETKKLISKFTFNIEKLEKLTQKLKKIYIEKPKKTGVNKREENVIKSGKIKEKIGETQETIEKETTKKETIEKEINIVETATEVLSEFIALLNIFTLYTDDGAKCILTDNSNSNAQITIIDDVNALKKSVYKDADIKDEFLKILNGRLTGSTEDPYPEEVIEDILDTFDNKQDKMVLNKIIMTEKKEYYTINEPDKLIENINDKLTPNKKEKDEHGEVFTPLEIVNDMLDKLDPSCFKKKDYKWLDPAVGIGNFPIIVYMRLMNGLKASIPDEEERRKHILEEMLYMVEISEKSVHILNKIFCGDTYKLNIHTGSFLTKEYYTGTKTTHDKIVPLFDIILANPPYNPPKTTDKTTGKKKSSGNNIWPQFVIKSFHMVKKKGYLLFIHPPGWKKPTEDILDAEKLDILDGEYTKRDKEGKIGFKQIRQGQVWQVLKDNGNFSFIYTNDQKIKNKTNKDYINFFPAVDYYVYQKSGDTSLCNTKNIFVSETMESTVKNEDLYHLPNYLPNLITKETIRVFQKVTTKEGKKPVFKRGLDERNIEKWNGDNIKWIYDANKKGFQYKEHGMGPMTKTGIDKGESVDTNKIVLNFGGGIRSYTVKYISSKEKIGILDKAMYFEVADEEGKHIEQFFNSDIVQFMFLMTQYAVGAIIQNEPIVANSISIPPTGIDNYYEFFGLSEEDKKYIEYMLDKYLPKKSSSDIINSTSPNQNKTLKKPRLNIVTEKSKEILKNGGKNKKRTRKKTNIIR